MGVDVADIEDLVIKTPASAHTLFPGVPTTRENLIHRMLPVALYKIKRYCYLVAARVNKPRYCYDFSSSAY